MLFTITITIVITTTTTTIIQCYLYYDYHYYYYYHYYYCRLCGSGSLAPRLLPSLPRSAKLSPRGRGRPGLLVTFLSDSLYSYSYGFQLFFIFSLKAVFLFSLFRFICICYFLNLPLVGGVRDYARASATVNLRPVHLLRVWISEGLTQADS